MSAHAPNYPLGDGKTSDSANWGLFKNNWGTIRLHCSDFKSQTQDQYMNGQVLNDDDAAAIKCQHEQIQELGLQGFYQAQRGVPGQGEEYRRAVEYVKGFLDQGHLEDGMVTFYNLHAV
ncbi:MAG: hypothetical protein Q9190_007182 [Brigantiaea leucoxantha]